MSLDSTVLTLVAVTAGLVIVVLRALRSASARSWLLGSWPSGQAEALPRRRDRAGHDHRDNQAGPAGCGDQIDLDRGSEPAAVPNGRAVPAAASTGIITSPAVRPLVLSDRACTREHEPHLPSRVVIGHGWCDAFFHGWCAANGEPGPNTRLTVRAAALRGATHASLGAEGQDSIGAAWDERRNALYLAVADGLGSLPRSGPVAAEAVNAALHLCANRPSPLDFADSGQRLYRAIAQGLRRTFDHHDEQLDGACTLVVAEVIPTIVGARLTVHGVGDSEAWVLVDGRWHPLHHERRSAADNATRELPTHVDPATTVYEVPPGSVLVLGSDGFTGALDTSVSPLARALAEYWRVIPQRMEFVNHIDFADDYWSDDRAAVAVWIGRDT